MSDITDFEREMAQKLLIIAKMEPGPYAFQEKPERWWDDPHWRCAHDHVSTHFLKSEELGYGQCFDCMRPVWLTFPEDQDGPLVPPETYSL